MTTRREQNNARNPKIFCDFLVSLLLIDVSGSDGVFRSTLVYERHADSGNAATIKERTAAAAK